MTQPSRKDRMRPAEYLLLAGGIALFSGLVTLMTTRDFVVTAIVFGIIFILALMTLALLALAMKPDDAELKDLDAQDRAEGEQHPH
jgi:Na+/melibiose symporter-like transporter